MGKENSDLNQGFIQYFYPGVEAPKNTYVCVACNIPPEIFGFFNRLRLILVHSEQCTDEFYKILSLKLL